MESESTFPELSSREKSPFIIRGHHLGDFINLTRAHPWSPEDLADLKIGYYRNVLQEESSPSSFSPLRGERFAAEDTVGKTEEQFSAWEQNLIKIYKRFLSLADEDPILLVEAACDEICKIAAAGRHCKLLYQAFAESMIRADGQPIARFLDFATANPNVIAKEIVVTEEEQTFPDDPKPRKVKKIHTTAGDLKTYLRSL